MLNNHGITSPGEMTALTDRTLDNRSKAYFYKSGGNSSRTPQEQINLVGNMKLQNSQNKVSTYDNESDKGSNINPCRKYAERGFQRASSYAENDIEASSEKYSLRNGGSYQDECSRKDNRNKVKEICKRKDFTVAMALIDLCT